jgi:hypothetical protein
MRQLARARPTRQPAASLDRTRTEERRNAKTARIKPKIQGEPARAGDSAQAAAAPATGAGKGSAEVASGASSAPDDAGVASGESGGWEVAPVDLLEEALVDALADMAVTGGHAPTHRSRSTAPAIPATAPVHEYCHSAASDHGAGTPRQAASVGYARNRGRASSPVTSTAFDAK